MSGWSTRRPLTPHIRGGGRPPFRYRERNSPSPYGRGIRPGCGDGPDGNKTRSGDHDEICDEITLLPDDPDAEPDGDSDD